MDNRLFSIIITRTFKKEKPSRPLKSNFPYTFLKLLILVTEPY